MAFTKARCYTVLYPNTTTRKWEGTLGQKNSCKTMLEVSAHNGSYIGAYIKKLIQATTENTGP